MDFFLYYHIHGMLSIIIAVFAYSLIDVSKTFQKVGIHKWETSRLKGGVIWSLGILGGMIASFLILYAVSAGSVILVGSLAGTGLVAVIIIARISLHERVGPVQIAAIAAIIAGPFFMAGASKYDVDIKFNMTALWFFFAGINLPWVIGIAMLARKKSLGLILAIGGGILSGLVVVFQKLAGSPIGQEAAIGLEFSQHIPDFVQTAARVMLNPYSAAWIFLSIISTIALQIAHKLQQAVRSIPIFNGGVILTPVLAGLLVFSEQLKPIQWIGVASIFIGIVVLILRPPQAIQDVV